MRNRETPLVALILLVATLPPQLPLDWARQDRMTARTNFAIAEDMARGRLVIFGGNSVTRAHTWEWDGIAWTRRLSAASPWVRYGCTMVYDPLRQRTLLFGGTDGNRDSAETWEWDGTNWLRLTPPQAPSARHYHGMTYDAARQRIVLFGGVNSVGTLFNDTWEWDGTNWTLASSASSPSPRIASLVYDAARRSTLLFSEDLASDTWTWDGTSWTQHNPSQSPSPRGAHGLAYDQRRQRVLLFGGFDWSTRDGLNDTWEWDGTTWSQLATPVKPPPRWYHRLAWFERAQRIVLFGAVSATPDHWEWDGTQWSSRELTMHPQLGGSMLAFDSARQRVLAWAGDLYSSLPRLWDSNGRTWTPISAPGPNGGSGRYAMTFDDGRQLLVLHGGAFNRTWEWDGTSWSDRSPAVRPPMAVGGFQLVYDAARQKSLTFVSGATWTWDGTVWQRQDPGGVRPLPRANYGLCYDSHRQRVIMFGGAGVLGFLNDTWEWDGTTWWQVSPPVSPTPRSTHSMAYDVARQRVVVWSGGDVSQQFNDLWEYDGCTWAQVSTSRQPQFGFAFYPMVYDAFRQRMVALGDDSDTWLLGPTVDASHQDLGPGCGTPTLDTFGEAELGTESFALDVALAQATMPLAFLLATQPANTPIGPCTLYVQLASSVTMLARTNAFGFASLRLAIPLQPSLLGSQWYAQAAVREQGAPLGLVLTNGLSVFLGE